MRLALTRDVSPALARCELTHLPRQPIDVERARHQHQRYQACLAELGCEVVCLPAEAELPDSVFVEDMAVVLDELAILTHPGAASRQPELDSIAVELAPHRTLVRIEPPATLDGGDVLRIGRTLYVGLSNRSGAQAVEQLARILAAYGYTVRGVPVTGCLHLKSAVSLVAENTVLLNPGWVSGEAFAALERIEVDPSEPFAANALWIDSMIVYPAACQRTRQRLQQRGLGVIPVDVSELAKAEGGVTCCSLILDVPGGSSR
jgi:dimethylargininase